MEDPSDVVTTIFADDTQSRAAGKTKTELEKRNSEGLTKICNELKAMRLKVNEGKTTYMVLASMGRRRLEDLSSEIVICGEVVKSVKVGKSLGLLVSDDLTWRHQTEKVVKSCRDKLAGLWKCTEVLTKQQRQIKAEAIILSRLSYCLEVVSSGRKTDMEKLQGVQSAAARWVAQTRRRDWHVKSGLKKLGWLSMCQQAAFVSLKMAMKVLKEKKPERLHDTLTKEVQGERIRKELDEKNVMKMKASTRKAWSVRSLRWMAQMPKDLLVKDVALQSTKKELKKWIRESVPVKGDRILWGQKLTREMKRKIVQAGSEEDEDEDGNEIDPVEIHNEDGDGNREDGEEVREESVEPLEGNIQHGIVNMKTGTERARRNYDEESMELSIQRGSKKLRRPERSNQIRRPGRYKNLRRPGRNKTRRRQRKMKEVGLGGGVLENLPRAGAEPQNPGKRGSLSPQVTEDCTAGQILLLWCTINLMLTSFMSVRQIQVTGRDKQKKHLDSEVPGEKKCIEEVQPRCGVG